MVHDLHTITVSKKVFSRFKTINEAIQGASPGVQIIIEPGVYEECIRITKSVQLIGLGDRADVVIKSDKTGVTLDGNHQVTIKGVTIHVASTDDEANAVSATAGNLHIEDCDLRSEAGTCMYISKTAAFTVRNCVIHDGQWNGLNIATRGTGVIEDCDIYGFQNPAVVIKEGSNPVIRRTRIHDSKSNGVYITKRGKGTIEDCELYGFSESSIIASDGDSRPVIRRSRIYDGGSNGVNIGEGSRAVIEDCEFYQFAKPAIVLKEESYATITGCKVHDGDGNGLSIGGKSSGIIENCELYHFSYPAIVVKEESNPTITNCTIRDGDGIALYFLEKGNGVVEDCEMYGIKGDCVFLKEGSNPIIRRTRIHDGMDSALYFTEGAQGTIEDCELYGFPEAATVVITKESNPIIRRSKIHDGGSNGLNIMGNSKAVIEDCEFYEFKHPIIVVKQESQPLITNCTIHDGEGYALFFLDRGHGVVEDCEIYGMESDCVLIKEESNPIIRRTRIHDGKDSAIYFKDKAQGTIEDCELYGFSEAAIIAIGGESNPVIRRSTIRDGGSNGVNIGGGSLGILEDCELYGMKNPTVVIKGNSNPLLQRCRIRDGEGNGLFATDRGRGTVEDCEIYGFGYSSVWIEQESTTVLRKCRIYNGQGHAVVADEGGRGRIEDCDIFDHERENLFIGDDSELDVVHCRIDDVLDEASETTDGDVEDEPAPPQESEQSDTSPDLQEVLEELHSFVGLTNVKDSITQTINLMEIAKERKRWGIDTDEEITLNHAVFYGNPGTGKTTIARLLGKVYKAMGLLETDEVVEVKREQIVGAVIGETEKNMRKYINKAMGGILFIDEAYSLTPEDQGSRDFGKKAIDTLVPALENYRGKFMCIVAGYEEEMKRFLESNPGLSSRFTSYFQFEDYTPDELLEIARKIMNETTFQLDQDAEHVLYEEFVRLYRKRDRHFGNARTVREFMAKLRSIHANRIAKMPRSQWTKEVLITFTKEDVLDMLPKRESKKVDIPVNEQLLQEQLDRLNGMIGLQKVKQEIQQLIELVYYYKQEQKPLDTLSMHMLLVGSPGTGKTEVAKLIAKIYEALGVLERGNCVEVDRDDFVDKYRGGTEEKTAALLDQAMDGTLFIDEAYTLTNKGTEDPGHIAVELLLKKMEDERGRLVVLAAGYEDEMEEFVDSNKGLRRRFDRKIVFEDYKPDEMLQIATYYVEQSGYQLSLQAETALFLHFEQLYNGRDKTYGNAGLAKKIAVQAMKNVDYRLSQLAIEQRTAEAKSTIEEMDIDCTIVN